MTARQALIIGGGIGGPVAAMALQRAGIDATIYEARDHPADYTGWFLNTASNGLDVLHTLGIDLASRADGHPIPTMVMWSGTGKRLGEVANGTGLADGTVSVCIKRGELQRVLRERRRLAAVSGSSTASGWPGMSPLATAAWPRCSRMALPLRAACWSARTGSTRPPASCWCPGRRSLPIPA